MKKKKIILFDLCNEIRIWFCFLILLVNILASFLKKYIITRVNKFLGVEGF